MIYIFSLLGLVTITLILLTFLIIKSLSKINKPQKNSNDFANVSIIVAAKNEAKNLGKLFDSFLKLNYPSNKFEILLIDDNSVDDTVSLAESYKSKLSNLRIIQAVGKRFPAKKGVLDFGISNSRFENILITDADCVVSADWLKCFSEKFLAGYDFIFGNVVYSNPKNKLISAFQQFEHLRSKILYFSAAIMSRPYSASGANFGFRKKSFYEINGYEGLINSFSGDDDLLIQKATKKKMKVGFINPETAIVFTEASENFKEFMNRKARHTSASYYYSATSKIFLGIWHTINIAALLSIFFAIIDSVFLFPFMIKIILDILIISQFDRDFGYKFNIFQIVVFQIFYEILIAINIFNGIRFIRRWE